MDDTGSPVSHTAPAALSLRGVSFRYPRAPRAALDAVSFQLAPGERVALLGPNGAGKSTLLQAAAGVLSASGEVEAGGVPARERARFWPRLGLVMQDPDDQLFMPTVFDDVAFGPLNLGLPPEEVRARVARALAAVGCEGFDERAPSQLSGGEKRRIALATALAVDPGVLLLDEPSAGLDPRGKRQLRALLGQQRAAFLLCTHELDLAEALCPRSLLLSQGKIVADAPTAELLRDAALLEAHGL